MFSVGIKKVVTPAMTVEVFNVWQLGFGLFLRMSCAGGADFAA
jgi:hypothetical protein